MGVMEENPTKITFLVAFAVIPASVKNYGPSVPCLYPVCTLSVTPPHTLFGGVCVRPCVYVSACWQGWR